MNSHDLVFNALSKGATSATAAAKLAGISQRYANDIINGDSELYSMLYRNKKDARARKHKRVAETISRMKSEGATRAQIESEVGLAWRTCLTYLREVS